MILVLTSSTDASSDTLMPYLAERAEVFRFNADLWRHYQWRITAEGYELEDPSGRVCREVEVGAVYERKIWFDPMFIDVPAGGCAESWLRAEVMEIWSGIKDLAYGEGKLALIHPSPKGAWKKMRQMRAASKYFRVPAWEMLHRCPPQLGESIVCKANTGASMGNYAFLKVSKVNPATLDLSCPWFLQEAVDNAIEDVTVAWINGHLYASSLSRKLVQGMDSRDILEIGEKGWNPCQLSRQEEENIRKLMEETGLSFARLDFMRTKEELLFLELNPNGQFVWMDINDERGMLSCLADEIMKVHHTHIGGQT